MSWFWEYVQSQVLTNELLAGGALLAAAGIAFNYVRTWPLKIIAAARYLFVVDLDITDRSEAFEWVSDWADHTGYMQRTRRISVSSRSYGTDEQKAHFSPAPGWHLTWWRHRPVLISRHRKDAMSTAGANYREFWRITMIGQNKHAVRFIQDCYDNNRKQRTKTESVLIHESGRYSEMDVTAIRKRPLSTIILPYSVKDGLMDDVNEFIKQKEWYRKMSVPWRRGYLLHGPPGNGKSSLIHAVASEINFPIYMTSMKDKEEFEIVDFFRSVPENSIILLEDIDCFFTDRDGEAKLEGQTKLNLSTLLNILDGVSAREGRIVFMTTNHPSKLDPALTRPGRADRWFEIDNPGREQIAQMLRRFFPDSKDAEGFAHRAIEYKPSMAALQGYLLKYKHSLRDARKNVKELENA